MRSRIRYLRLGCARPGTNIPIMSNNNTNGSPTMVFRIRSTNNNASAISSINTPPPTQPMAAAGGGGGRAAPQRVTRIATPRTTNMQANANEILQQRLDEISNIFNGGWD